MNSLQQIELSRLLLAISSWIDRPIAHPVGYIIWFFIIFYFTGLGYAKREREVAKHRLPLIFERVLFLRSNSQLTLNTILHQIYLITVTIISLIIILLKPDIAPNRVANWYARLTFPLLFIQVILIVIRVDILGSKRRRKNR